MTQAKRHPAVAALREQAARIGRIVERVQRTGRLGPRGVHRMRVASRRLRAALEVLEACGLGEAAALRRPVKRLTRALGRVRATDVSARLVADAAATARLQPLLTHLQTARRRAAADLAQELRRRALARLLRRPARLEAAPGRARWRAVIARRRATMRKRLAALVVDGRDPERIKADLHALRIAVKRLRYVLEIATRRQPAIERLKRVQGALGRLHDWEVARREVRAFLKGRRVTTAQREALRALAMAAAAREQRLRRRAMRLLRMERA